MNLLVAGCNFRTAPIELRERLALEGARLTAALAELNARFGCEAVILSTCNRVELYVARPAAPAALDAGLLSEFLAQWHGLKFEDIQGSLYHHRDRDAVLHLFRVAGSLDSLIVGEGQIAGQVKRAYEGAAEQAIAGPVLHALFQQALAVAKRVRTETGIAHGHVSVSSVAVDFVRQVFDHFDDKTVLVIGAGKMGELTLKHLHALRPKKIVVTNRSADKAAELARSCGGQALGWERLDDALVEADIVLSTTGAPEPIMSRRRFNDVLARRTHGTIVILDIAVPRDFDPRIHDGDRACLFNIDDLTRIREQTLADRKKHVAPAEAIVAEEAARFLADWERRRHGPVIAQLTREFEARRQAIVKQLLGKLNGKLTEADQAYIEGAFRLLQNQFLHGPISALTQERPEPGGHTLLEALRKLFRLEE
ncbi:MAG: glutamyl-tRNA reductase [Gemmataceae bacterium]|nr:glutamyl-tRNA reductase [Gemmataceae bacterium]MCI0738872.1 glutamyl-tRNA reductase [Gemmataceae bacterium]